MANEIFNIIGSKGRFYRGYEERRYLPPLEDPGQDIAVQQGSDLLKELNMLRGQVLYLNYKLNEHLEKRKSKQKRRAIQGIEL